MRSSVRKPEPQLTQLRVHLTLRPKELGDYDVEVAIKFCGVCASDVHAISGGWGKPMLPL